MLKIKNKCAKVFSHNNEKEQRTESFDDVYFSDNNGLEESRYVFLKHNKLMARWQQHHRKHFTIAETGFGTGLNFLMAWQAFIEHPSKNVDRLFFITFEKYPLSRNELEQTHQAWPELQKYSKQLLEIYPEINRGCHRLILEQGKIILDLWIGDIQNTLPTVHAQQGLVDAWFLDGFAPSKNPEMWQHSLFENMARLSYQHTTFSTFTAAGVINRRLIGAQFNVKKIPGFGRKREMLRGTYSSTPQKTSTPYAPRAPHPKEHIAIVGGGIASAHALLSLNERNLTADLFCKDKSLAQGASGNQQGAIYPLLQPQDLELSAWFTQAFLFTKQRLLNLSRFSNFSYDLSGVLQLSFDQRSKKKNKQIAEQFNMFAT